ncbi:hypothetical protein KP509_18G036900 [Ceratopteris richardii]|uniref:F-box domain-containing protein n=1 Tax=Ceratopteris richardii TaxID=49495 RepID=A0A8T2SQD4_CERRI|nr:hypothetical protein KP509_18G036900 [Ceratopteris richardii]
MDLPTDILESVFLRLSMFEVARSRTICKSWNAVLCSRQFLIAHAESNNDDCVALFSQEGRKLVLYNDASPSWHSLSLDFLPVEFTDVITAAGGLVCIAGQYHGAYNICVANPVTRSYKIFPHIDKTPYLPAGAMVVSKNKVDGECSYKIAILLVDAVALFSSLTFAWVKFETALPCVPQNPTFCNGSLYGLHNTLSPWKWNWRLVYTKLDDACCSKEAWSELYRPQWGEILDILHQPCLLESSDGCLLLIGGLGYSSATDSCITLIILKLDLTTLEWSEAARMPHEFYVHFACNEDFNIFGHNGNVYFSSEATPRLLVCKLSVGQTTDAELWKWVEDCPSGRNYKTTLLKRGFPFKLVLNSSF